MSWISNYVRPKIRALVTRTEVPDNLWEKCGQCGQMIFHRELEQNRRVCTHCGHHMRIAAKERLRLMFDGGHYATIELPETVQDPLRTAASAGCPPWSPASTSSSWAAPWAPRSARASWPPPAWRCSSRRR
jgi:acetyl-CoA carboxylase beta subunit